MKSLLPTRRIIGRLSCPEPGPSFIAIGGIHGNEPAGALALARVLERLEKENLLIKGNVVAIAGNLSAISARRRFIDEDLNRRFDATRLSSASILRGGTGTEQREQRELLAVLNEAIAEARGPVVLFDLHTTSGEGAPFAVFADTMASRNFARRFPVPLVLGLEEQLEGTLVDYIGLQGHVAVGFEGGQHDDPNAIDSLEAVVWLALGELGLVDVPWVSAQRRKLARAAASAPRILEMTYRHEITPEQGFHMLPGFRSFQRVSDGQVIAEDMRGPVTVPEDGYLLMPLYQKQGDDGFFVVQRVRAVWLWLSAVLRYGRAGRIAHWLPGVSRVVGERHRVRINRRIARWYSLELLHLLGFRRRPEEEIDSEVFMMERRAHDLP